MSIPIKVEVKIEEEAAEGPRWRASSRNERDNDDGRLVREDQDEDTLTSEDISVRPLFLRFEHLTNSIVFLQNFDTESRSGEYRVSPPSLLLPLDLGTLDTNT